MSAQIRRTNDRSRIVQESGRRLYATDLPYEEAMDQTTQKYLDSVKLMKASEFKKPYAEDDYGAMEYGGDVQIPPWKFTPINPDEGFDPGCKPRCIGAGGGGWQDCKDDDCAVFIFECCSKIKGFGCGNCKVDVVRNQQNDQCTVRVCSAKGKDSLEIKYDTAEEKLTATQGRNCCTEVTTTIGHTSHQMTCGGTQALTATPGVDKADCYAWSITSGGGSLSSNTGKSVVYTAPATNAECANNPTIRLTNGKGNSATLNLALNCVAGDVSTVWYNTCGDVTTECPGVTGGCAGIAWCCFFNVTQLRYHCDGTVHSNVTQQACTQGNPVCPRPGGCDCGVGAYSCENICIASYGGPPYTYLDKRTAQQKTDGCCPAQLL